MSSSILGYLRHSTTRKFLRALALVTWAYVGFALALGFALPQINEWLFPWLVSPMDKSAISAILSAVAAGMITLTGIVFSLVFVIVQFGSSTYSPRITRLFARMRSLRHALGVFTGTFVYSLMALRTVGTAGTGAVSAFPVWVGLAWLLASIAMLANLVRVFTGLTIGNVLFSLSSAGRRSIDTVYTPLTDAGRNVDAATGTVPGSELAVTQTVTYEGVPLYVNDYAMASLVALAKGADAIIQLPYAVGDALRDGEPIALIRGARASIPEGRIHSAITLGIERAFAKDPRYALRLLVDMAIRALSPAINDPTTAVQALDHIEMLLHRLGNSKLDNGEVEDENATVRLVYPVPGWEDFLRLSLSEIMQYGADSLQVQRRLAALLHYLSHTVPASRAEAVRQFADEQQEVVSSAFEEKTFREWAGAPDKGGLGGAKEP